VNQVVWHIEDALRGTIGDRRVEKLEPISFPREPTRREIAAFSVIVARRCVPQNHSRRLTIDDVDHPDQGTGRKVFGPITAELIVEDQPKRIIQSKVLLEPLGGVNQKPPSMRASPMSGFMHLASGAPKAGPRLPKRDRLHQSTPVNQDWRQKPPASLARGPLIGDVFFGVFVSVGQGTLACGFRGGFCEAAVLVAKRMHVDSSQCSQIVGSEYRRETSPDTSIGSTASRDFVVSQVQ
jgi:hypothetical protein